MIQRDRCQHCGELCEWEVNDGVVVTRHACAKSPTGNCEPPTRGQVMVRSMAKLIARKADQRGRGYVGTGKRRPGSR